MYLNKIRGERWRSHQGIRDQKDYLQGRQGVFLRTEGTGARFVERHADNMTRACRRQAVTEESGKSTKIISATGPRGVPRFLLRGHVADIYARHEPGLDALNTQCWEKKTVAQGKDKSGQKWDEKQINGAGSCEGKDGAGSEVPGILRDRRSQKGQVGADGWEGNEGPRKKGGGGRQKEGTGLVGGQRATPSPSQRVEGVGVNVSFAQYFMTLCPKGRILNSTSIRICDRLRFYKIFFYILNFFQWFNIKLHLKKTQTQSFNQVYSWKKKIDTDHLNR